MAEAAARPRIGRVGVGVIVLGMSFGYAAGVVGPAAAPMSHDLHVSLSAAGLLTSVFFIALAALAVVGAAVEEKLGIAWSARWAAALMALGGVIVVVSPWFGGVLAGRAVAGIGTGVALIASPVIARALKSVLLLGLYGGGITFGLAAALFIGGQLQDAGVDWRVNFGISAAVGLAALPFLLGRFPEVPHMKHVGLSGLGAALKSWRFWRLDLLFIFINGIPIVVGAWLLHYLTIHHGLGAGVAGDFGFLLFGVQTIARPVCGKLATTPPVRLLFSTVGPAVAALGLLLLAIDRHELVAALAVILIAVGFGAPYAIAYQRVEDIFPGNPELGLAVALQGVNLSAILVAPLVGAALEHGYGREAFVGLGAYCVAAGIANFTRSAG
ncbi:MAG TPA: MFS transporter [Gaiellaceae bacterium]